ncbi:12024_t:CDS:2 [Entrophospora sp. SA101]|nr:12024_t:CDS:2 [Entrophospora sp. SA101]
MKYQYKELADEEIVRAVGPNPEVDNSDEEKEVETVSVVFDIKEKSSSEALSTGEGDLGVVSVRQFK